MRAIFMGKDKASAVAALEHLLEIGIGVVAVVAPDSPDPDGRGLAAAARRHGLPLASDTELYARLDGDTRAAPEVGPLAEVDLVLSFLFWKRIRKPLIELPRVGCINFHPAPLPDFRGLGGYNVAILEGLAEWGVAAHFVDESFDTGDLIRVERFAIRPDEETAYSLERTSQVKLLGLFERVIELALERGPLPRRPQGGGRYISREEFEAMRRIRPDDPPEVIDRKIRAFWFPPYPGATVELAGEAYTVVSERLLSEIADRYRSGREPTDGG